MSRLSLVLLLLGCTASAATAPEWMVAAQKERMAAYNSQQWAKFQSVYNADAVVIPPSADSFISGNKAGSLYKSLYEKGWEDMVFDTKIAEQHGYDLWHELGVMTHEDGYSKYYIRWYNPNGQGWKIDFDATTVGMEPYPRKVPAAVGTPPNWLLDKDYMLGLDLNSGEYATAAHDYYRPGAIVVPPYAGRFVPQTELPILFKKVMNTTEAQDLQISPLLLRENDTVVHEIGTAAYLAGRTSYYTRWEVFNGQYWYISFQLMSIGA